MEEELETEKLVTTKDNCPKQKLTKQLFQELAFFGINREKSNDTSEDEHLILSVFELITTHRQIIRTLKESKIEIAKLKDENSRLKLKLDSTAKENSKVKLQCENFNKQLIIAKLENENSNFEKEKLQKHIERQVCKNSIPIKTTVTELIDKNSSMDSFQRCIMKYKHNESIYQETIRKLEENNKGLLDEILNLKEEIAIGFIDRYHQ